MEKKLIDVCSYSHDYDGSVYEEKSCACSLYQKDDVYFIRRHFTEKWDRKTVSDYTEDIAVKPEDLKLGVKKLAAVYCNGRSDNEWIDTYRIHRDEDAPDQRTAAELIAEAAQ